MKCRICGEEFSRDDIRDLKDMHEEFFRKGQLFICPDCWDDLNHTDPEDQINFLLDGEVQR